MIKNGYKSCVIRNCVALKGNHLFHCPKAELLFEQNVINNKSRDVLDYSKISTRDEMKKALKRFYVVNSLDTCCYCNMDKDLLQCETGIQATQRDIEEWNKSVSLLVRK